MSEAIHAGEMIYTLIPAIMADITAIGKDKRNAQQGFNFRGIDDVMNVMKPILSRHQVFTVPEVLEQVREVKASAKGGELRYSLLRVRFRFYAPDGSHVDAVTQGEGMDSGDKASNKAMAIAYKYALFQVFCIPTEEMIDPDAESHETLAKPAALPEKELSEKAEDMRTGVRTVQAAEGFDAKAFIRNYMAQTGMEAKAFAQRRAALIAGGAVPDIPSGRLTEAQACQLVAAMEQRFAGQ